MFLEKMWSSVEPTQLSVNVLRDITAMTESADAQTFSESGIESGSNEIENEIDSPDMNLENDDQVDQVQKPLWTTDKRYKTHWKGDPDELYKSYREMDKEYPQLKAFQKHAQESEIKIRQEYESKNTELSSKLQNMEQISSFVDLIDSNPEYSQKLAPIIQEIIKESRRKQYGADLPDNVISQLREVDQMKAHLEEIKQREQVTKLTEVLDSNLSEIDQFVADRELEYDKDDFLAYCEKNKIPAEFVSSVFYKIALPQITQSAQKKGSQAVVSNLNKNKGSSLPSSTRTSSQQTQSKSFDERFLAAYNKE